MRFLAKALAFIGFAALAVAVCVFVYFVGYGAALTGASPTATPTAEPESAIPTALPLSDRWPEFQRFWEAWDIVSREFYGELPPPEDITYGAIRGALSTLGDSSTFFVSPARGALMRSDIAGTYEGIGIRIAIDAEGRIVVTQVFPASGAEEGGVQHGDVIVKADDVALHGKTLDEAAAVIRGPAGTSVHLLLLRGGQEVSAEVTRRRVVVPVVEARQLRGGTAYLRIDEFNGRAAAKVRESLEMLLADEPAGLVLDLRGNPGGLVTSAVEIASQFTDQSPILIEQFKDGLRRQYNAEPGGLALDVPLVVLIDGGSASASEIVAGALQDFGRATLIGEPTFGKGSVQLNHELSDGSQLRVTVAHWLTPGGRELHGRGLMPDILAASSNVPGDDALDPQLQRALEFLEAGR